MQFRTARIAAEIARTGRQLARPCTVTVLVYSRLAYHAEGSCAEVQDITVAQEAKVEMDDASAPGRQLESFGRSA